MKASDFARAWASADDNLEPFNQEVIEALTVSDESKSFLSIGLPSEAAPFLTFGPSSGAFLQSASDEFGLPSDYDTFKIIGHNSYGDPICIDESDETVVYLNHDDGFGYVLMNSSVAALAQFLLVLRDLIDACEEATPEAKSELAKATLMKLRAIDSSGLDEGGWSEEVESVVEDD